MGSKNKRRTNIRDTQGPDTSVIISEILTSTIDIELKTRLETDLNGIRIIDDYLLFFKERNECEQALSYLHEIFKKYELEMNPTKIQISELPYVLEPIWKPELRQFYFRIPENSSNNDSVQRTDLITYFSRVNEFCKQFPDTNILKYGIKRIHNQKIYENNLPLFESLLLKSALTQSSCIVDVAWILIENKNKKYGGKKDRIDRTISELIRIHCKYSNEFEIAWALWLAKEFEIIIMSRYILLFQNLIIP
jgi:hypothetical protein